jgi:RhtB (resistance to homoserine/threonine) family protein
MIFSDWLTVFILGLALVVVPGPNFVMTLRNSLLISRRAGLLTASGIALGGATHVAYSLAGVGVIISQSIFLFGVLKWLGAAYLVWLGIKALRAEKRALVVSDTPQASRTPTRAAVRIGYLTCLLNPKSTLFFFALFTQIVGSDTSLLARLLYGMTVVALQLVWYSCVALVISQRTIQRRFAAATLWIERLTGAAMIGLGIRLVLARRAE